jgi:hypothetical protein
MSDPGNPKEKVPALPRAAGLMITAIEGIEPTASALAADLAMTVEIAASRAAALRLLDRRQYAMVVLDQNLADSDPEGADLVWRHAGLAIPLQVNFALAGTARLLREMRAGLSRRQREQQLAGAAAMAAIDSDLKNAVTGFLLESRLALSEAGIPPGIETRLRTLEAIADRLRDRLGSSVRADTPSVPLSSAQK